MQQLDVLVSNIGDRTVIKLSGDVDLMTAPYLREALVDSVDQERYKITVDLNNVDFIDSTGLGVLVGGLRMVKGRNKNGEISIACSNEKILRIFKITGLEKIFPISDSVQSLVET